VGYGLSPIFLKLAYAQGATLLQVQFWRFLIATVLLWAICLPLGVMKNVNGGDVPVLLKAGALGGLIFAGISIPQFIAMYYMSASVAQVLYFIYPVWVALASSVITKTRLRAAQWGLLALLIVSIALTLDFTSVSFSLPGVLFAMLASVASAVYILFCKLRIFRRYAGLPLGMCVMTGAMFCFTLLYAFFEPNKGMLPGKTLLIVAGMAVISTFLAMSSYFSGIQYLEPVEIATLAALEPVVTIVGDALIMHVRLGLVTYIGAAMLIASITAFVMVPPGKRGNLESSLMNNKEGAKQDGYE